MLAPVDEPDQGHAQADGTAPAMGQAEEASSAPTAAKPKSQVPAWREGLAWSVLPMDYQRILQALTDQAGSVKGR